MSKSPSIQTTGLVVGFVLILLLGFGCGGSERTDDEMPAEKPVPEIDGELAEDVAENPCGNPDWGEPPPDVVSLDEIDD